MPDASRHALPPGTRLNAVYEIVDVLAAGGMGIVYRARSIETGEAVAVKMISPGDGGQDSEALLRREALALRNLRHDAIVRYFMFAHEPVLKRNYLVMEYVEGTPLSDLIRQGPMAADAVDLLRRRVARGLDAAHRLGIVHRDVSPDNIVLPGGDVGQSKIIDFGIARTEGQATIIGNRVAGKQRFMSPEQVGLYGEVTARSDIYSLGLVLVSALRGEPLDMGGTHVELIRKRERRPDLGSLRSPLRPLLERMLQPRPEDRPASMQEVADWEPAAAASPAVRRRRLVVAAGAVAAGLALVVALGGPAGLWDARRLPAPERTPPPAAPAPPPERQVVLPPPPSIAPTAPPAPAPTPAAPAPAAPAPMIEIPTAPAPPDPTVRPETPDPSSRPNEPAPRPAPGPGDLIRQAQLELRRIGCHAGPANGMLDVPTREAFALFARRNGLAWSGDVQEEGLAFLRRSAPGSCEDRDPPVEPTRASPRGRSENRLSCGDLSERGQLGALTDEEVRDLRLACR